MDRRESTVNVNYTVNISAEYGQTSGYACMLTFNPNTDTHPMWSGTAPWTVNQTRTFTNISIPAKNVTVIKIKPTSACSP